MMVTTAPVSGSTRLASASRAPDRSSKCLGDEESEAHADTIILQASSSLNACAGRVVTKGSPSSSSTEGGKPAPSS